jgi:hypothetical protein
MRFMMLIKGNAESEAGVMPSQELIDAMMKYNEELANAGALIDLNGLHASRDGAKVRFSSGKTRVIDGPFTETKEVVAGYWIIKADSLQEAVEWAKRAPVVSIPQGNGAPGPNGEGEIEVRQIFEMEEFGASSESVEQAADIEKKLAKNKDWSVR